MTVPRSRALSYYLTFRTPQRTQHTVWADSLRAYLKAAAYVHKHGFWVTGGMAHRPDRVDVGL